jgi:hypothetical protein
MAAATGNRRETVRFRAAVALERLTTSAFAAGHAMFRYVVVTPSAGRYGTSNPALIGLGIVSC